MKYKERKAKRYPMDDLPTLSTLNEDYFEVTALKSAVWQYLIDHGKPVDKDLMKIYMHLPSEQEFWRRVKARKDGVFSRNDLWVMNNKMQERSKMVASLLSHKKEQDEINGAISGLKQSGTLLQRVVVWAIITLKRTVNRLQTWVLAKK